MIVAPLRSARSAAAVITVTCLALAAACGSPQRSGHSTAPVALPLEALDGGVLDLARYRGRIVVLHLFTTWSLAAQADTIQLTDAATAHPSDVTVIGVALDPKGYRVVSAWRRATQVPYLISTAGTGLREGRSMLGRIRTEPTTVILDRRGVIAERVDGPLPTGHLSKLLARLARKR